MSPAKVSKIELVRTFIGIYISFCFFLAAVAAIHYYTNYQTERLTRESTEALNVELARQMIITDITTVISDLLILADNLETEGIVAGHRIMGVDRLSQSFRIFSEKKKLYDQVRYLDETGMEVIRVNYAAGKAEVVPQDALQNKVRRYYFQEAMQLGHGEIYVSPLDLNIEEGRIEEPYKPVMRLATPVFDMHGERRGIVVLNYLGERLIHHFKQAAVNIADHIQLINDEGYWLSSHDPDEEWGFMFGNQQRFDIRYPETWNVLSNETDSNQVLTEEGFFSYTTVAPAAVAKGAAELPFYTSSDANFKHGPEDYHWKIISRVPLNALAPLPGTFVRQNGMLYGSLLLLLMLIAYLLANSHLRHQWSEAQSQYERRFRQTLERIKLAAVSVDRNGRVTFCNDYFLELTGWQVGDIVGSKWVETFVPKELKEETREILHRLNYPTTFPLRYEGEVETKDGGRRLVTWNNTLSFGSDGRVLGVTSIGEDITDQRRNEQQIRKLSRAIEQSPSIVLITDQRGLIEYVNPKFTEVTGYLAEEVIGKNPRILKSGETSPDEYRDLWKTIMDGGVWRGEFHNQRKNGELYWEAASISALRDNKGEVTHFLSVKEDITERKRLEETVEERNKELAKTQSLAAMGRMATMIAHDLRNPLSSVKMGLQIFSKKMSHQDAEMSELCHIGLDQVRYMEHILSDMLTFSRPEAMRMEWISIDKILTSVISMVRKRLDEDGVELSVKGDAGLPTIPADANKLRQLFTNLILNAAQAVKDNNNGGRFIHIESSLHLTTEGTFLRVEICDNGHGLGDVSQEQLFEPFYTTHTKGTGLGLAIVKQIADQHHADVQLVQDKEDRTCAIVMLPTVPTSHSTLPVEKTDTEQVTAGQ